MSAKLIHASYVYLLCVILGIASVYWRKEIWLLYAFFLLAVLLYSQKSILLLSLFFLLLGAWRADSVLPDAPEVRCQTLWQVVDIPKPYYPIGQRLAIAPVEGCGQLKDKTLIATHYTRTQWQVADTFQADVHFRAGKTAYFATLKEVRAHESARTPSLLAYRADLSQRIERIFSKKQQKWVKALMIGDRTQLSRWDNERLRHTGTSHLLAISGLHLAIMVGLVFLLVQPLWAMSSALSGRVEPRSAALLMSLFFGFIFVLITGAYPPILRAWLMFAMLCGTWFFPRYLSLGQSLILAAIIILLIQPLYLFHLGMYLSFFATALVIQGWRLIKNYSPLLQWTLMQGLLTFSMLPFIWALFGGISLVAFLVNWIVVPYLGLLLIVILLALVFPPLVGLAEAVLDYYLGTIRFFSSFSFAYIEPFFQPLMISGALFAIIILFLCNKEFKIALALFGIIIGVQVIYLLKTPQPMLIKGRIPIGLVWTQQGVIVINTGYRYQKRDDAAYKILPEIRRRGAKIRAIVLTSSSVYANSALKTLKNAAPNAPIYSLQTMKLPFEHEFCPQQAVQGLEFLRGKTCRLRIDEQWQLELSDKGNWQINELK